MFFFVFSFIWLNFFLVSSFVVRRYGDIYLIIPRPIKLLFLLRKIRKKDQFLENTGVLELYLNLLETVFVFVGYNQSLRRKSNFILLCIFKYVTYINSHPVNPFSGKFWFSRRKPSYQYYLICN